jgi:hypothetical protein
LVEDGQIGFDLRGVRVIPTSCHKPVEVPLAQILQLKRVQSDKRSPVDQIRMSAELVQKRCWFTIASWTWS